MLSLESRSSIKTEIEIKLSNRQMCPFCLKKSKIKTKKKEITKQKYESNEKEDSSKNATPTTFQL